MSKKDDNFNKIKSLCQQSDIFISFRDAINVSSINPKNTYGTPTGVYTYPVVDFIKEINKSNDIQEFLNIFPFKGRHEPNFIYFYKMKRGSNVLNNASTFEDIKPYYEKILKLYRNKNDFFRNTINNVYKYVNGIKDDKDDWFSARDVFASSTYDIRDDKRDEIHKFWTLTYHLADDDVNYWSNILRKIGIDAFVDHGGGYIHSNEPIQSLLLNRSAFELIEHVDINDTSEYKKEIKNALDKDEDIDIVKLFKIYYTDPGFVFNIFLVKTKKGDVKFLNDNIDFIIKNKNKSIINLVLKIFNQNIDKLGSYICRIDSDFIKLLIDKFGDEFYKIYIDTYSKYEHPIKGMGEDEDVKRKIIVGSLLYANKEKTLDFFRRNKNYNFNDELEFLHDDPKLIKKYKDSHSYYFGDIGNFWDFIKEDDPVEIQKKRDIEHKYELFKETYEKTTGTAWDFEKFKDRSKNWIFYGDYNGYVAVRPQASGYYKLVGSAGDYKSVMRGINDLIKEDKPVWGMMSKELADLLVKRYKFYMPPKQLFKYLFNLVKPKSIGDTEVKIDDDGSVIFNYEDTGEAKKYFVGNKKYYNELLENEFFEKNKVLQKMLRFFIKRIGE